MPSLTIEGRKVPVSNLDKVLYPDAGYTKADVINFYIRVSQYLLPHFRDRPVTLKRYPDGVRGEFFYEKDAPAFTPDWVQTFPVPRRAGGSDIRYILVNDLPTLVWCANAASLELHPFLHRVPALDQPTSVVFDLDPGEGADLLSCAKVALLVRDVLSRLQLKAFPKVSGSKGLQLYVPLNGPADYSVTQPFARALAELMSKQHRSLIVSEMAKVERNKKVFIDWSQNADYKTTVGVYSLRAKRNHPYVSLPVSWEELEEALQKRQARSLYFDPESALTRLAQTGDLFGPVLSLRQSLPPAVTAALTDVEPKRTRSRVLREYDAKRNFSKTPEPEPTSPAPRPSAQGSRKRFVIQKHAASHLHYDFRLEMHSVLKSWAVPKGLPYDLGDRRLAMATEDHPLGYLEFEGTIPKGQYGGGTVMVWDIGTYELMEGNYYKGDLQLFLSGKKMKGEWRLTKDRKTKDNRWFIEKSASAMKPLSPKKEETSAVSSRTMDQIASDKSVQWHSNRSAVPGLDLDALPESSMGFIQPMLAQATGELPQGDDWQYEVKLDGYRALAIKDGGHVQILSRRNNVLNDRFPQLAAALDGVEDGLILDGEITALDERGRPSFNLLQHNLDNRHAIVFYAFDVLAYRRRDLRDLPLTRRLEILNSVLADPPEGVRLSVVLHASAEQLISVVREQGLEGIIAKRSTSRYESGERSGQWLKFRVNKGQELVIGGYRPGKTYFDNLAVGYYEESGRLIFIAKIKNGFTPEVKRQVFERFRGLETKRCPFDNLPEPKNARRGEALTAEAMKNYRWLKPELVAQVEFTDWTASDHLRHSRFVGMRDDKVASEVGRE